MRDLIVSHVPSSWSSFSVVVFAASFVMLAMWVFTPRRKILYDRYSQMPLNDDATEEE